MLGFISKVCEVSIIEDCKYFVSINGLLLDVNVFKVEKCSEIVLVSKIVLFSILFFVNCN